MFWREFLRWAANLSPEFVIASSLIVFFLAPQTFIHVRRKRWVLGGFFLLILQAAAGALARPVAAGVMALTLEAACIVVLLLGYRESARLKAGWLQRFYAKTPLVLAPPFEGQWKALGSGPWPPRNPHMVAIDQWFAVDWVREDAPGRGSRILSPTNGVVAYVEDGHPDMPASRLRIHRNLRNPAGNYISIRVPQAENKDTYVILAHLENGSLQVAPGQMVRTGDALARCGNSGNTTVPHLHIHAQPEERVAPGTMWGLPIVFCGRAGWMRPGEVLMVESAEPVRIGN